MSIMNIRNKTLISSLFVVFAIAFMVVAMPIKTHANGFDVGRLIDPLCLFACDNDDDDRETTIRVVNTNTNTNTNNATVNNTSVSNNPSTPSYPTYPSNPTYPNHNYSPIYVSCYSTPTSGMRGDSIRWRTSISGGNGDYYITWSGSDGLNGNGTSVNKAYYSSGSKYASVHVVSSGQSISKNCGNNVDIYNDNNNNNNDYYNDYNNNYNDYDDRNLTVSCSASATFAPVGTTVNWTAHTSGGNGRYSYTWDGTDYLSGHERNIGVVYSTPGPKTARVSVRSNGREVSRICTNTVTVGVPIPGYQNPAPTVTNNYYTAPKPPVAEKPVVEKPAPPAENPLSAASYFSLSNVPWGWVAILIIVVLLSMVIYLMYNKKKI